MHIFYPIGSNLLVFSTEKRTKDSNSRNNDNLDKVTKICFVSTWASSHKIFFFFLVLNCGILTLLIVVKSVTFCFRTTWNHEVPN